MPVSLVCIECGKEYDAIRRWNCECGGLLEVAIPMPELSARDLDKRLNGSVYPFDSGVWIYKELVHPLAAKSEIVSKGEGRTRLYSHAKVSEYSGVKRLYLKHEGENPTGSFKDRGMTVGITEARRLGLDIVGCASTGNTSGSLASYAAAAGMKAVVFIPSGEIAYGKLAQTLAYGARVVQLKGNFDDAMRLIQEACKRLGIYLLNSVNPWRIEGQKTIAFELAQQLGWRTPDWVALPAGNLGNTAALGKAFSELKALGFIEKVPRIAAVQAEGANPFYRMWKEKRAMLKAVEKPETLASAIKIGNPVSWKKAAKAIRDTNGVVESVSDQEILDAKAVIDSSGIGCEPASAASLAGVRKLHLAGVIKEDESIACILTGNILKDPDSTVNYHKRSLKGVEPRYANMPMQAEAEIEDVISLLQRLV